MEMQNFSESNVSEVILIDFGCVPVDTVATKYVYLTNISNKLLTYRMSLTYIMSSIDHVFNLSSSSDSVKPGSNFEIKITFKPNVSGQSFTEYYTVDNTEGKTYRLTVTGRCYGPKVSLNIKKLKFSVCKNISERRKEVITLVNTSSVDTTYQWLMPPAGQGYFQISTGNCGLIRAFESITTSVVFNGTALGVYTAELVCLVLNQEPLFLNVCAIVILPDNPVFNVNDHIFEKGWKRKSRSSHLMENSLNRLSYIPCASVFERYLDFGMGSVFDVIRNISQTLCVTNHEQDEGYIQWIPDPDNIFLIDPIACNIPPNESRLFTVRFRPKIDNEVYGFMMCGDYQFKVVDNNEPKQKHTLFRIPCIGNTWSPCTEWTTEWDCPVEVILPPTVPARTTFSNFMLSNKLEIPMYFKFEAPYGTNFVVLPMCGIVQSRGWQIITVALEPKCFGDYCESWDLVINRVQKARINLCGNAELSQLEVMSAGYNSETHVMYEFPPTIPGCTNYVTTYLHNVTRMEMHMRVLNTVPWLGADNCGTIVIAPKEIIRYHWWFFPKTPNQVYDTTVTCSCVSLIDGRPVGEPTEILIHIFGFSELPDLQVVPKYNNLHDIAVGENASVTVRLFNYCSCYFTSRLYHEIYGMGDDYSGDTIKIDSYVNSLKPTNSCEVTFTVTPDGAGSREINIKYTVLFRTEFDEIEEIQPIKKKICVIWYDGIYPTFKIKRTISVTCPVILSNHCVWNITNVDELNKALEDCRPNEPINVTLYAPDLCIRPGFVEFIFVLGSVYDVPVPWSLRREKICNCPMVEFKLGISTYELRHDCVHRPLVELFPVNGFLSKEKPELLHLKFRYDKEGLNTLCYVLLLPNERQLFIYINIYAHLNTRGILTPLRRPVNEPEYLAVMDCGIVPINNLDSVIRVCVPTDLETVNLGSHHTYQRRVGWSRSEKASCPFNNSKNYVRFACEESHRLSSISSSLLLFSDRLKPIPSRWLAWLYNPTDVFTTWRLLRGNMTTPDSIVRCLLFFAEIPPLGKLPIPFAFLPTEMIKYEVVPALVEFLCSFGYETMKIKVTGQGGLPNSLSTRLDIPSYVERSIRGAYRTAVVYLSTEHMTIPIMPTHSLTRDVICICNDTDHIMRFIWLPERIPNIVNIVMTPCWGVIQPKTSEWITMTVYTLQEPATFTTTLSCEILDLTERRRYQRNELLKRQKTEKCKQEFIITEKGFFHPGINDSPPYVLDIEKPQPTYVSLTVSVSSKGQRDAYIRMLMRQQWEQTPQYDLLSDLEDFGSGAASSNTMTMSDIIRIIDGIIWDALHSKMFRYQIGFYSKEEIPTYNQLVKKLEKDVRPKLSRRVTSGICDAIVNKAVFHMFGLNPKQEISILEAV